MTPHIVVTGASGFVGQALLSVLGPQGVRVTALTRDRHSNLATAADRARTSISEAAVLVHLAQRRDPSGPVDNDEIALCRILAEKPWRHIVYASSALVYGDRDGHPRRPQEPVSPVSHYARAKLACERIFSNAGGTSLRLTNLYGPGMGKNTVIADILRQIPGEGPLRLHDPTPVRDFLWIDDAARCIAAACRTMPGGVLNAGKGHGVAVADVARLALALAGEDSRPLIAENAGHRRSILTLDISETCSKLGWSREIDLAAGLAILLSASR